MDILREITGPAIPVLSMAVVAGAMWIVIRIIDRL